MAGNSTLADWAGIETDKLKLSILNDFRKNIKILEKIDLETTGKLGTTMVKWNALPTPTFKRLNQGFDVLKGQTKPKQESVSFAGFYIDVDKRIAMARNGIVAESAKQQEMCMHAFGCAWNDTFINGESTADNPETPNGIRQRLDNDSDIPAANKISAASTTSGGLDVMASSANQHAFLDCINKGLAELPGGDDTAGVMMLCSPKALLAMDSINQRLGLFPAQEWSLGRKVRVFGQTGVPIISMGYKVDDSTSVISQTEASTTGSVAHCESIYLILPKEDYCWIQQEYPIDIRDLGLQNDGITYRTVVDWPHTPATLHKRALVRIYDLYFNV
jgi:hypothetical protein